MDKFIIVEDLRTNKLYLDYSNSFIRSFEKILAQSIDKKKLLLKFPDIAGDLTIKRKTKPEMIKYILYSVLQGTMIVEETISYFKNDKQCIDYCQKHNEYFGWERA
jgi:hypothetical protein